MSFLSLQFPQRDIVGELRRFFNTQPMFSKILVAVSGGRDSMALLHGLYLLNQRSCAPIKIEIATVHHGLRQEATLEVQGVLNYCDHIKVPAHVIYLDPPDNMPEGAQAWARQARYQALESLRQRLDCQAIALAHHRQDQVETMLFRLFRGAVSETFIGIQIITSTRIRPLLNVSRNDIDRFVAKHHIPYFEDPTNATLQYTRNRIRHELTPVVERIFGDSFATHLLQLGTDLFLDNQVLSEQSQLLFVAAKSTHQAHGLDIDKLKNLHLAHLKRVLRQFLLSFSSAHPMIKAHEWQRAHVESLVVLVNQKKPHGHVRLPHDFCAYRQSQDLWIE